MDFEDTPEEAAFRARVRQWIETNAPRQGDDAADILGDRGGRVWMKLQREWQARKAAAGYARITWPNELGGMGGTPIQQVIFNQEESKVGLGGNTPFAIGLGMCIPTLM